jgi:nitroreductase
MDTLQTIRTHRVVRRFRPDAISETDLRTILDAGRLSGSSKNSQRWAFIAVRDRDSLQRLAAVGDYAGHLAGAAAAVALVTPTPGPGDPLSVMWDLGRCAQNMTLAAWSMGIGSVPATVYDQPLARQIMGHPDDRWCEYLLSFGYPADPSDLTRPARAGGRQPLDELLHDEHW